jgi:peroxiredoxin
MAAKKSRMLALGTALPEFALQDVVSGRTVSSKDFAASDALLVAFICNHCPYVKHILEGFVEFAREYGGKGLAFIAISSNDPRDYPDDSPARMAQIARDRQFSFPYLFDESQAAAKAFEAMCTPDFFLFDRSRRLVYRGQFDSSRPNNQMAVTGSDMRAAADAVLAGRVIGGQQTPSVGCSIKWKSGNAPDWA